MEMHQLSGGLIVGAGHGIGLGLVRVLLQDWEASEIIATYRDKSKASELLALAEKYPERLTALELDPLSETDLEKLQAILRERHFKIHLLLNACGYLHDEDSFPEKRLKNFDPEYFLKCMKINSLITPMLLSALEEFIPRSEETLIACLSAKVGSISDNSLGGWYSYRASKAALNMLIKTAAIEYQRTHKKLILLSIHPGTTRTDLSAPFLSGTKYTIHTPEESARNILNVLKDKTPEDSGKFYSWDGALLPW